MVFGSDSLFFSRPFPSAPVVKDHVVVIVKVGLCFGFFFFVSCGWDVGGVRGVSLDIYLPMVVWFSWVSDYLICFLSWLWMKVMFSRKIGVMDRSRWW